jgi:hypothetical protein
MKIKEKGGEKKEGESKSPHRLYKHRRGLDDYASKPTA